MNRYALIFCGVIFLLLTALLTGCKCDDPTNPECPNYCVDETNPECPNYNPCWDQTPVSADFRIIENGSFATTKVLDTVYFDTVRASNLIFEVLDEKPGQTYTWQIGAGVYDTPRVSLNFAQAPKFVPIEIKLMVQGTPNTNCFPEDTGTDTMVRKVVFTDKHRWIADYHGFLNGNPEDTITLKIYPGDPFLVTQMYNFKRGCEDVLNQSAITYRKLRFVGTSACDYPNGILTWDPDKTGDRNKVRCEYTLDRRNEQPNIVKYIFEGRML